MIAGTIGAIGNGVCMPIMTILLGDLINAFGENQNNNNVVHVVSKVAMWMVTGERQAARIRNMYLKSILRQDVSFFDKDINTREVISRI
ncbi:putative ABC transporter type 1, transmembrane domain-containing protein [Helianthus anomalus]